MRTEREKMLAGDLYDPLDRELVADRQHARDLCQALNATREAEQDARRRILRELFGAGGDTVWMQPPFFCDYGTNIELGERVFFNFNCVVLDVCRVRIGAFSLFGPAVQIYTPMHPLDAASRRREEFGKPVDIDPTCGSAAARSCCPACASARAPLSGPAVSSHATFPRASSLRGTRAASSVSFHDARHNRAGSAREAPHGLHEASRKPNNQPEVRGRLTQSVIERRNDYVHARGRYCTMMDWERDDLVKNLGDLLGQCERDVQERKVWHLLLVHDDYGTRVGKAIGVSPADVAKLQPLEGQVLTADDQARLKKLEHNGDKIDPTVWGTWTSSVTNYQANAEEVLNGMRGVAAKPAPRPSPEPELTRR